MRFLNKIIFINSASIPYSEIKLDGNIHFIGTQGVGKSTILRAILYFYNADSRKLGIPKGPTAKSFVDWYLGYGNSYLIYEVARETGSYCILAYKSQNRVCYRFIDSIYDPTYFINESGEVYSNWDAIRQKLDAGRINVSPMVNSFDDYRNILYGNYTGRSEFNKYALLETKQYNNIYRTIQNVFLNTKLDATEIKQTIISSMEDDEIEIDLDKYSHHLKDFETELADIRRFRLPSVNKQAKSAMQMLSAIRHLRREQFTFIARLKWRLGVMENVKPELYNKKRSFENELQQVQQNKSRENNLFLTRKDKTKDSISLLNGKLKDIVKRKDYYRSIQIDQIIKKVSANNEKKGELESLAKQQAILTNNFSDIKARYDALIQERNNGLNTYINQKQIQKVNVEKEELKAISSLNAEYEKILDEVEKDHEIEINTKQEAVGQKTDALHQLEKAMLSLKHKLFYEADIKQLQKRSEDSVIDFRKETNNIENYKQQINNIEKKWDYEKADTEKGIESSREKLLLELDTIHGSIAEVKEKINNSSDSLYGWLNENKPNWPDSIGKVIQEDLLFKADLSPKLVENSNSIFGVNINLSEIDASTKSIEDYQFELEKLEASLKQPEKALHELTEKLENELEKVQRGNLPKIKALKEKLRQSEYHRDQMERRKEETGLEIKDLENKAAEEKKIAIDTTQAEIDETVTLKQEAVGELDTCKVKLKRNKESKQREKTRRIHELKDQNKVRLVVLDQQSTDKRNEIELQIATLTSERNDELHAKGADTDRLSRIEEAIFIVKAELQYIDENRIFVIEYEKDKRELFDREKEFKNLKKIEEAKLAQLQAELVLVLQKFEAQENIIINNIQKTKKDIQSILDDEAKYDDFIKSSIYTSVANTLEHADPIKNSGTGIQILDELTQNYYGKKDKEDELKTNIDKFLSYFSEGNIFKFPSKILGTEEYLKWAEELNDFIDEGKIDQFEKRSNERFASIINTVGKETTLLISKTGEIKKIINKINSDFRQKNFVSAVSNIELDITDSKNTSVMILKKIKEFNDEHALTLGAANLFSGDDHDRTNEKAVGLLKHLVKETTTTKDKTIKLSDSFELSFRIEENGNDTGWVEKLSSVGSEGTDVLVKAMINIMLLNVFKEGASRKFKDFKLHCMMDEIGKLHPNNVKGILKFANDRNILLINGSPTESTPLNYRHIYKIHKDTNRQSRIKRIISNNTMNEY